MTPKPSATLPGTVEKIIKPPHPSEPEIRRDLAGEPGGHDRRLEGRAGARDILFSRTGGAISDYRPRDK